MDPITISMDEYEDARGNYVGWCTTCNEFTRDSTEPDAQDYDCPQCNNNTVIGAEYAMMGGQFEIE
jgi:Zn finger protein HypA/HybF involved in hydrogenase expression